MAARRSAPLATLLLALAAGVSPADEISDKQKAVARENLKKADVANGVVAESDNLILCTPLPEVRAKAVVAVLEKTYTTARKGLQFEAKEEAWKGKLTIYHVPEQKDFTQFMRVVTGAKPDTASYVSLRGDEPYAVVRADLPKATDADLAAEVAPVVANAVLTAKAGSSTVLPAWVRGGFGRAAALRAGGVNGQRFSTYKTQAKIAVAGRGRPTPLADVWDGGRADGDVLATSLMDYLTFGPGAKNLSGFLSGLKPDENGDTPAATAAVVAAGWKVAELEVAWRKWVQTGMPEAKAPPAK